MSVLESGDGFITEPRALTMDVEGDHVDRLDVGTLNDFIHDVCRVINGGITLGSVIDVSRVGNLDAQYRVVDFPAAANTSQEVYHDLERTPTGYIIVGQDRAGDVYEFDYTAWTETRIILRCSVASLRARILVF